MTATVKAKAPTKEELAAKIAEIEEAEALDILVKDAQGLADEHIALAETWHKMIAEMEGPWVWEEVEDALDIKLEDPLLA